MRSNRGRPGVPPGVYFRMLMVGYLEGIGSERGIAWRCADSFSLREFLGYGLAENPPEHSTLSKTRKRLSVEAHAAVFGFVLERLQVSGLLRGKTLGVDATTLEANAALRTIVRRADGTEYEEWLAQLARASGIETPTREDLAKLDRKASEQGVEQGLGASARSGGADHEDEGRQDTPGAQARTRGRYGNRSHRRADGADDGRGRHRLAAGLDEAERQLEEAGVEAKEVVADKGYHSNATMTGGEGAELRTYVSEPNRGRRKWKGKRDAHVPTAGGSGATGASGCSAGAGRRWSGRSRTCLRPAACAASTFGARRIFENEFVHAAAFNPMPSGSALEPPVHCRASLSTLEPASCAFSPVSGAFPPFLSRISPPHARRPASCTAAARPAIIRWAPTSSTGC